MKVFTHLDIPVSNLGCGLIEFPDMGSVLEGGGRVIYKWMKSGLASKFSTVIVNAGRKWINIFVV